MADSIWPIDNGPAYTGRKLRQTASPLLSGATPARPLGSRSGVRPGTSAATVTATATTWTCGPLAGVADVEAASEAGAYQFAFDASTSGAVSAAGGSARTDTIWVQVDDPTEGDGTAAPVVRRVYTAGGAAAPARAFAVAKINVPATGGGNPSVTWVAPFCVAAGGILPTLATTDYPATPYVGQYLDDITYGLMRWNGTAWTPVSAGLNIVKPTSVVGGTISQLGAVSFTNVSALNINGVFTAAFDQYEIVVDLASTASATAILCRLRKAGADTTVGFYAYTRVTILGTTQSIEQMSTTFTPLGRSDGGEGTGIRATIFAPFQTRTKKLKSSSYDTGTYVQEVSSAIVSPVSYDGFSVFSSPAVGMTGKLRVYGFNNG